MRLTVSLRISYHDKFKLKIIINIIVYKIKNIMFILNEYLVSEISMI